jgi:hypothetical protein
MISTKKRGRVTIYYWDTEERGKTYLLKGKRTVSQQLELICKHIKYHAKIPRAQLHFRSFRDGYAIFDREGRRLYYGRRGGWKRTKPFLKVETMHEVTDWAS